MPLLKAPFFSIIHRKTVPTSQFPATGKFVMPNMEQGRVSAICSQKNLLYVQIQTNAERNVKTQL